MNERVTQPMREFDPSNPYDAMCETFRRQITEMVIAANRTTIYRDMSPNDQLGAFMSGGLCGIIGVAFSSVHPQAHDTIMQCIVDALPLARKQVEDIIANGKKLS